MSTKRKKPVKFAISHSNEKKFTTVLLLCMQIIWQPGISGKLFNLFQKKLEIYKYSRKKKHEV